MSKFQETVRELAESLDEQIKMFTRNQQIHFDWLDSVKFELDVYDDDSPGLVAKPVSASVPVLETLKDDESLCISPLVPIAELPDGDSNAHINRSNTAPSFEFKPHVKFVDDSSLLLDAMISSEDDDDGAQDDPNLKIPFTVTGSYSELSQTASSFHAHWQSMLEMKKVQTITPASQARLAYEESEPTAYELTDDEETAEQGSDEEIYERNPSKIHGKEIPMWARQDQLMIHLREQKAMNADEIFTEMPKTCLLSKIFEKAKQCATENDPKVTNQKSASRKGPTNRANIKNL